MANTIQSAIFQTMVEGVLKDIYFQTHGDHVIVTDDGVDKTLTVKLAEIITSIGDAGVSEAEVNTIVTQAIADLVDSAPESLDTLRELAEAIQANDTLTDALNSAIGNKVDKVAGSSLVADSLIAAIQALDTDALATINSTKIDKWDSAQENVIEKVAVNGSDLPVTNKGVDISVPTISTGTIAPTGMKAGDLFLQIID